MSLYRQLQMRAEEQRPLRVGVIGAGKFGTMFLAQAVRLPGVHVVGIADLAVAQARSNLALAEWPAEQYGAASLDAALQSGATFVGDNAAALITHPAIEIIVECTGNPVVAVQQVEDLLVLMACFTAVHAHHGDFALIHSCLANVTPRKAAATQASTLISTLANALA